MINWYYKRTEEPDESGHYVLRATGICSICGSEFQNDNVAGSKYCDKCRQAEYNRKNRERVRRFRDRQRQKVQNGI